jgi:hypothetical protein
VVAAPRGILFDTGGRAEEPVAVGDWSSSIARASRRLERVLPRSNWLSRTASSHDPREQVLARTSTS